MGIDVTPRVAYEPSKESNASVVDMILPFDLRRSAGSAVRPDLERRLRADEGMYALLDILDSTDDRPKAEVHELHARPAVKVQAAPPPALYASPAPLSRAG
jgi:hypothetical protein